MSAPDHRHPARLTVLLWLAALWLAGPGAGAGAVQDAEAIQDLEAVRAAARDFVLAQQPDGAHPTEVEVGRLDGRLRLGACEGPLQTRLPPGGRRSGNTTVQVRCEAPRPWSLYVPVKVRRFVEVLVTARPLTRGQRIGSADVELAAREEGRLHAGYFTEPAQVLGQVARRPLAPGKAIGHADVAAARLVRRGDRVRIVARSAGLTVRSAGKALEDGARGQVIRVRNARSQRVVEAAVTGPGRVEVQL